MTDVEADPVAAEAKVADLAATWPPPWLAEAPPDGALAALVRVELPSDALPWAGSLDDHVLRRRAQYTAGVELIAREYGALEPLVWEGDALTLVFGGTPAPALPVHAYKVARELWSRVRTELGLPVRIGVHVGRARAGSEPGTVTGTAADEARKLAGEAPTEGMALSEDLALALPDAERRSIASLGVVRAGDDEAARLRGKLRTYAGGPDVRDVRYVGFRLQRKEPPRLDIRDVFVRSEVELRRRAKPELQAEQIVDGLPPPWAVAAAMGVQEGVRDFREVYARHRSIVLLGDPGSGKTTLLRWLSVIAASGSFALAAELGVGEPLLPLPVSIGRLTEVRRSLGGEAVSVPAALARYFHERSVYEDLDRLRDFIAGELERGRCLVLLDGLDEVKSEDRRGVHQWLESFASQYAANRFVVSSRVVGYTGFQLPGDAAEVVLRPFTDEQVERYVRVFQRAYVRWETRSQATGRAEADALLEALRASPRLSALAKNPFMLSALALIHRSETKLPRHRVQAYEVFARALCETWAEARRLVAGGTNEPAIAYEEEALPVLGELALAMHVEYPTGVAPEEFVLSKLAEALEHHKGVEGAKAQRAAREFLKRAGEDVQILLERGAGEWGFLHLTFQEFFVAAGLHYQGTFEDVAVQHLFDPRWEEVIRLGVGYLALIQKRGKDAERFVRKVLETEAQEPRKWFTEVLRKQVPLAALLAAEVGDALPAATKERVVNDFVAWLKFIPAEIAGPTLKELALTDLAPRVAMACRAALGGPQADVRAKAVRALGALRDPDTVDVLLAALADEDEGVRNAASSVPGEWGNLPRLFEKVEPRLTDPRPEVRAAAVELIAHVGDRIPWTVLERAIHDADENVRHNAVVALLRRDDPAALAAVRTAGNDPSWQVRLIAVVAMMVHQMNDALVARSDDDDEGIRALAIIFLYRYDRATATKIITTKQDDIALLEDFDRLKIRETTNEECFAHLTNPRKAHTAALELARRGVREGLPYLVDEFSRNHSPHVANALADLGAAETADMLVDAAETAVGRKRAELMPAIGRLASLKHAQRVTKFLDRVEQQSDVTGPILAALWSIADREVRRPPDPSG